MGYFLKATKRGSAPRIHPLLLSLSEVYTESDESPKISTIAEDDPKALRSNYYTPPSELPPLDIHVPGQDGTAPL
jgi:hypothetical protein